MSNKYLSEEHLNTLIQREEYLDKILELMHHQYPNVWKDSYDQLYAEKETFDKLSVESDVCSIEIAMLKQFLAQ